MRYVIAFILVTSLTLLNASALFFQNIEDKNGALSSFVSTPFDLSEASGELESAVSLVLDVGGSMFEAFLSSDLALGLTIALEVAVLGVLLSNYIGLSKRERSRGRDMLQEDFKRGGGAKPSEIFFIKEMR